MPVRFLLWVCAGFVLGGCVPGLLRSDAELAQAIAEPARLQLRLRAATPFVLTTRERFDRPGEDLNVYLEGDGFAWASRTEPSRDPTPDNPLALALAARDPAANVVWIARPCQYTPRQDNPACREFYWTVGRLAPEVVRAVDVAVSAAKLAAGAKRIHLVGYSGGGGLALLIAAGRSDVISIRTVAGNLHHQAFTSHHGVSPMSASLEPADVAPRLRAVAQWHFVGGEDKVVPAGIARAYLAAVGPTPCARLRVLPGLKHQDGWVEQWPALLRESAVNVDTRNVDKRNADTLSCGQTSLIR